MKTFVKTCICAIYIFNEGYLTKLDTITVLIVCDIRKIEGHLLRLIVYNRELRYTIIITSIVMNVIHSDPEFTP